jgi:hypothetical protein
MSNKMLTNGLLLIGAGLLASSLSSFLTHFAWGSMEFVRGFLDGLSVVAFAGALYLLVRARKAT